VEIALGFLFECRKPPVTTTDGIEFSILLASAEMNPEGIP
jgi:hypothetical protein